MHIVAVHGWQQEAAAVAKTIAGAVGILVFEARQKIAGGGPAVLTSFADPQQAAALAARLMADGVPTLVIDSAAVRGRNPPVNVRRFSFEAARLRFETHSGQSCAVDYGVIELLIIATSSAQTQSTETVTERKFSLGKTVLAGGLPMTGKETREVTSSSDERDETLWLYADGRVMAVFARSKLNYDGFGAAMQVTRDLNFTRLKNELRRLTPQAGYDDRLLKRAGLVRLLGPSLSPETDLDLACEILARSLRPLLP